MDKRPTSPSILKRTHPASHTPGHSRESSETSSIDAFPAAAAIPDHEGLGGAEGAARTGQDAVSNPQAPAATIEGAPAAEPAGELDSSADTVIARDGSAMRGISPHLQAVADSQSATPFSPSPLRSHTTSAADLTSAATAPGAQVTFSIPDEMARSGAKVTASAAETEAQDSSAWTKTTNEALSSDQESHGSALPPTAADSVKSQEDASLPPSAAAPPPLPSILKPSPPNNSRTTSMSGEGDDCSSSTTLDNGRVNSLLHPPGRPHSSSQSSRSHSPSSPARSSSPAADRTRIVGKGGYGGRRGGPALNKSRTSSSGGLSDVDMRAGYERKVGFDTMVDADDTPNGYFTFCLQVKSTGYQRTKNTRTFMCAVDDNTYSERALEWLMESLVSDGDEIVALRVLEGDPDEIDQEAARDDARELMASIVQLNDEYGDRSISIVVEFVAGRVTPTILGLIYMYRPDSLTVGTRGRSLSTIQKMFGNNFMGSCSRDILNRSPVPVVIVRPEAKVKKHLAKRQNDPKRRSYHDLVALTKNEHLPLSKGGTGSLAKRHGHRGRTHAKKQGL